eukprot:m.42961 g.42961  ORF g.42961 m.42961 type:complete len:191 (-) comp9937_c0_seq1:63-635(-)
MLRKWHRVSWIPKRCPSPRLRARYLGGAKGSCWCGDGDGYCLCTPSLSVDIVIVVKKEDKEHVLLVERRFPPQGWAVIGGYVDVGESVENAVQRETLEEVGIEIPLENLSQVHVFSDPLRDFRRPSAAVLFVAQVDSETIDKVTAGDDANAARLFPVDDALAKTLAFGDHFVMIQTALSYLDERSTRETK